MRVDKTIKPMALGLAMTVLFGLAPAFAQSTDSSSVDTNSTSAQSAMPHEHHKGGHHHHEHCQVFSKLNLSADQKTQLKAMRDTFKKDNASDIQDLKSKHEAFRAMIKNGQGKSSDAQAILSEIKAERSTLREKYTAQLQTILTPEQFQKMQSMKEQCHAGKSKWHKQGTSQSPS